MQSPRLSNAYAFVCIALCTLFSTYAYGHDSYGPEAESEISTASSSCVLIKSANCPPPRMTTCMQDDTITTYAQYQAAGGSVTIPPECTVNSFSFDGEMLITSGCTRMVNRTYTIGSNCGEFYTCSQLIVISDTEAPVFTTCMPDVTVSADLGTCASSVAPPMPVAVDDCNSLTITYSPMEPYGVGTTPVVFTADDGCGNTRTCNVMLTVTDSEAPNIPNCNLSADFPALSCTDVPYSTIAEFEAAANVDVTDCSADADLTITSADLLVSEGMCPDVQTIQRTYTISDPAGFMATCVHEFVIRDDKAPTFTTPADMTVDCGILLDTSVTGVPTNIVDCDPNAVATFVDASNSPTSIIRTWTVTDSCGLFSDDTQIITFTDMTPPVGTCESVIVYLDAVGSGVIPADSVGKNFTDNCGPVTFAIQPNPTVTCNNIISAAAKTLVVTDQTGLTATCAISYTVLDTVAPIISHPCQSFTDFASVPDPYADAASFMAGPGTLDDGCQGAVGADFELLSNDTTSVCPFVIERIYEYTKANGKSDTALQKILVEDLVAPVFSPAATCGSTISIDAMGACDVPVVIDVAATDDSGLPVVITNDLNDQGGNINTNLAAGNFDITFTATDSCGNEASCVVTIDISGTDPYFTPPLLVANPTYPTDFPIYVDSTDYANNGGLMSGNCMISGESFNHTVELIIDPADNCDAIVLETFSVLSADSLSTYSQTRETMVTDMEPPTIDCSGLAPIFAIINQTTCEVEVLGSLPMPVANDNFGNPVVTNGTFPTVPSDPANPDMLVFTASDGCNPDVSCSVAFTLIDNNSPLTIALDTLVSCSSDVVAFATLADYLNYDQDAFVTDCTLDPSTFAQVGIEEVSGDTVTYMYTISDMAQPTLNSSTITYSFIITDNTNPVINVCAGQTIQMTTGPDCQESVDLTLVEAIDDCGNAPTITTTAIDANGNNVTNGGTHEFFAGQTIIEWIATDDNGNMDTCYMSIIVEDMVDPILSIAAITADCISNAPELLSAASFTTVGTITENCLLDNATFTVSTVSVTASSSECKAYERTYSIADTSGNVGTIIQQISIVDNEDPVATPPNAIVVVSADAGRCDAKITLSYPTVTDNCGVLDTTVMNHPTDSIFPVGTTVVTWAFTDSCENTTEAMTTVIVQDNNSPLQVQPVDTVYVQCDVTSVPEILNAADIVAAGGEITDPCGFIVSRNIPFEELLSGSSDTLIRNYVATDNSPDANSTTFSQVIIMSDTIGIMFTAPRDTILQCPITDLDLLPAQVGDVDETMLMDNCMMGIDTIYYLDRMIPDSSICPQSIYIERQWVVVDSSWNETRDTQIIFIVDTLAPVFDSLPDLLTDIECNDPFPGIEVLTATDGCDPDVAVTSTSIFTVDQCSGYEVIYRWYAEDACGNIDSVETSFDVLPDTQGPVVQSPGNVTISNDPNECFASRASIPTPIFTDNCSGFFEVVLDNPMPTYDVGPHSIQWTAYDSCLNTTLYNQTLFVRDTTPPQTTCKKKVVVALDNTGNILLPISHPTAQKFYKDAKDNCGVERVELRRTSQVCGDLDSDTFREAIRFCCEDIGDTVDVEVKVIDIHGNESTCTSTAIVQENLAPIVMGFLPNITISCEQFYNLDDLTDFGTYQKTEADRRTLTLTNSTNPASGVAFRDGLVTDGCDFTITEAAPVVNLDICAEGTITRRFNFEDTSGNMNSQTQIITIEDIDPFFINRSNINDPNDDVIWPAAFTWGQCVNPAPDTSISGAPIILNEDKCSQVSFNFKDLEFTVGNGGCNYIRRTWTVIDWCQDDNTVTPNPGRWTYNQDIYVVNTNAPDFTRAALDTVICVPANSCDGLVRLSADANDDCSNTLGWSYQIDIDNDGVLDFGGLGNSIDRIIQRGTHTIAWTVLDHCGNDSTRVDTFTVRDCKAPQAVCLSGLSGSLGNDNMYELWASDVNNYSSDNCTATQDLLLSFSADVTDNVRVFTDANLGNNTVQLWVTDEAGNQSFCTSTILIEDNYVPITTLTSITGHVFTHEGTHLQDSKVSVVGAELSNYSMTDGNGDYTFTDLTSESNLEVFVSRDGDYLDGVNTLDLVKIQRHILNMEILDNPYKIIAADANNDERVTPADLLALRKLILGVSTELPNNNVWRFVEVGEMLGTDLDPWPFSEEMHVSHGDQIQNGDFVGVKVGDVNNTIDQVIANKITTRSPKYFGIVAPEHLFEAGESVTVPLANIRGLSLQALQMTLTYDANKLRLVGVEGRGLAITDDQVGKIAAGHVTLSWNEEEDQKVEGGTELFAVVFEAIKSGSIKSSLDVTSDVTPALAFDNRDEQFEIFLDYYDDVSYNTFLHQNKPNPFFGETVVDFDLPEAMEVEFTLFDATGRIYWNNSKVYPAGQNALLVGEELSGSKGVFYLKMDAAEYSEVIKMIKIQ